MKLAEKAPPGVLPYCTVVQKAIEMRKLFRAVGQVLAGNELGRVCALTVL
jgi:formate/nitrite transporter FocA (FNT family)